MENSKLMDIIAYYLSEYDIDAVFKLGYASRSEAFREIGSLFGKNNNYLKRLRDEYDVVTSSTRNGQCNRSPRERIITTKNHLYRAIQVRGESTVDILSKNTHFQENSKDIKFHFQNSLKEE